MKDLLLGLMMIGVIVGGYFAMSGLGRFLENNNKRIHLKKAEEHRKSYSDSSLKLTQERVKCRWERFKKNIRKGGSGLPGEG